MVTAVLLRHNGSEQPFRFLNTHLDHVGAQARYLGAMEIVQRIAAWREPFVLTGDFNAPPDAPEIRLITAALAGRGAVDCTAGLPGTFHDYGRLPPEKRERIDYIFTDGRCLDAYAVPDQPVNGQYYSPWRLSSSCPERGDIGIWQKAESDRTKSRSRAGPPRPGRSLRHRRFCGGSGTA